MIFFFPKLKPQIIYVDHRTASGIEII